MTPNSLQSDSLLKPALPPSSLQFGDKYSLKLPPGVCRDPGDLGVILRGRSKPPPRLKHKEVSEVDLERRKGKPVPGKGPATSQSAPRSAVLVICRAGQGSRGLVDQQDCGP